MIDESSKRPKTPRPKDAAGRSVYSPGLVWQPERGEKQKTRNTWGRNCGGGVVIDYDGRRKAPKPGPSELEKEIFEFFCNGGWEKEEPLK